MSPSSTDHLVTMEMDPAQDMDVVLMDQEAANPPTATIQEPKRGRPKRDAAVTIKQRYNENRRLKKEINRLKKHIAEMEQDDDSEDASLLLGPDKPDNGDEASRVSGNDAVNKDVAIDERDTPNAHTNAVSAALLDALRK